MIRHQYPDIRQTGRHNNSVRNAGFTLIELVVVIVILGILAATAVPKFMNMGKEARGAAVESLKGAVIAAATLAHMKCAVTSGCDLSATTSGGTVTVGNVTGQLSFGYPSEGSQAPYIRIDQTLEFSGFTYIGSSPSSFTKDGATDPATCMVTYSKAGGILSVSTTTSGC